MPSSSPAPASASAAGDVPDAVRELAELRTEFSKTFANDDGSRTTLISTRPVHFATAAGWTPIDTTLVSDAGSGLLRTVANGWSAAFAPDGVRVRDGDDELTLLPIDAAASTPQLGLDRASVTYDDVWPGVDVRYRVFADEVKEEIVLERRPDRNAFAFSTTTPLQPDPAVPGGLVPSGALATTWRVPPPEVLDADGVPIDDAVASLTTSGTQVTVTVDQAWLDALAPSDFPVVVDPSYVRGLSRSFSYRQSGARCGSPCPIRMGNPDTSWRTWRAAVHFPYESLFGKKVTHAQVEVWGLSAGTITNFPSDLYHSTGDNWHSVHELLVDNASGGGNYVYAGAALTSYYDALLLNRTAGASLKFVGDESNPGSTSYKQFDSFQLRLDWTERPPALTGSPSASPTSFHQGYSTTVSQPWAHPTEDARLFVCKGQGVTASGCTSGTWGASGWTASRLAYAEFEPDGVIGTQRYWTYMCTSAACSSAGTGTFDVLNLPPTIGTVRHSPDPVREGQRISFSVPFWDYSGRARAVVCKTDDANGGSCAPGQRWTNNGSLGGSPAVSYLDLPMETPAGRTAYYAFACDADGGCSPSRYATFMVHDPATPTSVGVSPDPVDSGRAATFTVAWDRSTESNKAVICRTEAITQGKATCPGGALASSALSAKSPSSASFTPSAADAGVLPFYVFMCTAGNSCSRSLPGTMQVNDPTDPSTATLEPRTQVVNVAGTANLRAQVEKLTGGPLRGRPVTFTVAGAHTRTIDGTTSLSGEAVASYSGTNVGPDVVRFQVDDVPSATAAAVVVWRPTSDAAFSTEVMFDAPSSDRVTRGVPVTVEFQALTATGSPFAGTVRYGVAPFGAPPPKVLTTTVGPGDNGRGAITFTPTTAGVWEVFAFADRAAPDGVFGAQDTTELDGASAVVAQEPCGSSSAVAAYGPGTKQRGTEATVTALVVDNCGSPRAGVPVTFVRNGANPGTATSHTDHEGLATHTWTGTGSEAIDIVEAGTQGGLAAGTALVVWTDPPPPPPSAYVVTLTPPTQVPMVGDTARVVAHVADEEGIAVPGATVRFTRSGVHDADEAEAVTDAAGDAEYSFVGSEAGLDTVTAEAVDAVEVAGDPVASSVAAATVVWQAEPPTVTPLLVTLTAPQTATPGSSVSVTATVTTQPGGGAVAGAIVHFTRRGANGDDTTDALTGANGEATYGYKGNSPGPDVVTAVVDGLPPAAASTVIVWAPAVTPPALPAAGAGVRARGFWLVGADGGVFTIGDAPFHGSNGGTVLNEPIVGTAPSPSGDGYWFVAADGGVFSFGDAVFHGSTGAIPLNEPIVGMAAVRSGRGYWLVARDGGVFAFGDAPFLGSMGGSRLNQPIVGMAPTPSGRGYWLVARDGGVFSFGDAAFFGSTGDRVLNEPIVGMAATATGQGYWFVAADGGVFAFGDARFLGSAAGAASAPVVAITSTPTGAGYLLAAADGSTYAFGDAVGSAAGSPPRPARPIVGAATA